jgi:diguanylate cyclase
MNPFVLANYRVRTLSFVMAFAIFAAQLFDKHTSPVTWGLLVLQFFIYPHFLFWRARQASHPLDAELKNLLVDAFLLGLWCAVAGFPVWVTFTFFSSTLMNVVFYRNLLGAVQATLAFVCGSLLWGAVGGWHFVPGTDTLTTVLCIVGLLTYLITISSAAYQRSINLRDTRRELRGSEQALHDVNAHLKTQLNENQMLQSLLKEQVNRDPLTGLYNRRYLDSIMERELVHCKRENRPLSLMLIDIDYFKAINDNYGHPMGDQVIKQIAQLLQNEARLEDVVCRFGGEEFLLWLPNMPRTVAIERAERWRQTLAGTPIVSGGFEFQVTLSAGIAIYPEHGVSPKILIGNADQALYRAKSEGRNRVVVYSAEDLPQVDA